MTLVRRMLMLLVMSLSLVAMPASLFADDADDAAREKISQEGEAAAAASANIKPTAQMIIDKVTKASGLLTEKGQDAFASFKGKDSEFIFAGTYIWIHDMEGVMLMHPIKYKMEGKRLIGLKDKKGKLFFAEMNKIAREKGQGWVSYLWPKPGETESSLKVSFVKLCKMKDGTEVVIGCGVYDMAEEEVVKLTGE